MAMGSPIMAILVCPTETNSRQNATDETEARDVATLLRMKRERNLNSVPRRSMSADETPSCNFARLGHGTLLSAHISPLLPSDVA